MRRALANLASVLGHPQSRFLSDAGGTTGSVSVANLARPKIRSELVDAAGDRHITYQTPGGRVIKDARVLSAAFGDVFNDTPQQNGSIDVAASQYDGVNRLVQATQPEGGSPPIHGRPI